MPLIQALGHRGRWISVSSRPDWATEWVRGQPLYWKRLFQNNKQTNKKEGKEKIPSMQSIRMNYVIMSLCGTADLQNSVIHQHKQLSIIRGHKRQRIQHGSSLLSCIPHKPHYCNFHKGGAWKWGRAWVLWSFLVLFKAKFKGNLRGNTFIN